MTRRGATRRGAMRPGATRRGAARERGIVARVRRVSVASLVLGATSRLPSRVRRPVGRLLAAVPAPRRPRGRLGSALAGLHAAALVASGRRDAARVFAVRRGSEGSVAVALGMARFLGRLRADQEQLQLLRSLPESARDHPALEALRLRALTARRVGYWREAQAAAEAVLRAEPSDREMERVRSFAEGRLAQLAPIALGPIGPPPRSIGPTRGRVLHFVARSLRERESGATVRTQQVALAQRSAGLDPRIVVLEGADEGDPVLPAEETLDGIGYLRLATAPIEPGRPVGSPASLAATAEIVERVAPAVLHAATPARMCRVALVMRRRYGLPVVYEVRGFLEEAWLGGSRRRTADADEYVLSRAAETECMLAADAVVTLGRAMNDEIVARGVPTERITVVPHAVDTERFTPGPRDAALAARLGISGDDVVAGYISTFQEYEDLASLVRAIDLVRRRGCAVRGLIVGEGRQRARLGRLITGLGLEGIVVLTGRVPHAEIPAYHRIVDVFVVPRHGTFLTRTVTPLKPFEAMASGRPVVVSRLEALQEVVRDGETGRTFEAGDATGLAEVLEELATDAGARSRLGRSARAWVSRERTLEKNGQRYRALYERLGVA